MGHVNLMACQMLDQWQKTTFPNKNLRGKNIDDLIDHNAYHIQGKFPKTQGVYKYLSQFTYT